MTFSYGRTSRDRLADADPMLQMVFNEAIKYANITILETHRPEVRQNRLFKEGKSKVQWPNSKHNTYPSRAVDCALWVPTYPHIMWDRVDNFYRLAGLLQGISGVMGIKLRFGIDWDNDWATDHKFLDGPHCELMEIE